jgi:hypothetical protein
MAGMILQDLRSRRSEGRFGGPGTLWVPLQESFFLVVVAGFAADNHQKLKISGRQRLPEPLHRVSRVNYGA